VNRQRHPAETAPGLTADEVAQLRRLLGFDRPRQHRERMLAAVSANLALISLANQPMACRHGAAELDEAV
jgi:hypothetical protein